MSFRNIRKNSSYLVLRTRPSQSTDEGLWQDIYRHQLSKVNNFAVDNWVAIVLTIASGIGFGALGFYLGQKYSTVNVAKQLSSQLISPEVRQMLPEKIRKYL
jgi:hypothetical protein